MESATTSFHLSPSPLRILIADSDARIRHDLRTALESAGHRVIAETDDGARAMEAARIVNPDLALLEVKLSIVDGIEAARWIHDEQIAPSVLITDALDRETIQRATKAGVFSFLSKPCGAATLLTTLEIAYAQWSRLADRREDVRELTEQLRTRLAVGQAKSILMERHGLKEKQAFREIQMRSMNRSEPMRAVAETIIHHAQLQRRAS